MKKWICLTAAGLMTAASAAELKVCIDGESKKASGNVTYIAGGIRQVPGRFGRGLLIERRTVNSFAPADVIVHQSPCAFRIPGLQRRKNLFMLTK